MYLATQFRGPDIFVRKRRYDLLLSGLLLTLVVVIAIDRLSALVRRMFLITVTSPAPAE